MENTYSKEIVKSSNEAFFKLVCFFEIVKKFIHLQNTNMPTNNHKRVWYVKWEDEDSSDTQ